MFAVIKTGGKQYKTQEGDVLHIEKINKKKGQKLTFDKVLLIVDDGKAVIGTPVVKDASVKAVVLDNIKDKKIIVFKKKRRKRYKKKAGHRQLLTKIKVEEIVYGKRTSKKEASKPKQKKEAKPKDKRKTAEKKTPKKNDSGKSTQKARKGTTSKRKSPKKKSQSRPKAKKKSSSTKKE